RVGRAGVAGEREGLAAAAAEILSAPRARRARLLHPVGTAEGAERGRGIPDVGERMIAYRPELEARDALCGVARQDAPGRRHVERSPAPVAHARLGIFGVIVGHDRVDDDAPAVAFA